MTLSGSPFTARDMAARFSGANGLPAISEMIRRLPFVEGNSDVADQLAAVALVAPYELGEVLMGPSINPIFLQRLRQEGAMSGFGLDWDCGLSGELWRKVGDDGVRKAA